MSSTSDSLALNSSFSVYQSSSEMEENLSEKKERELIWIVGKPCTGKTFLSRILCPNAYWKMKNPFWDMYHGQENIILDDWCEYLTPKKLWQWLNPNTKIVERKGSTVDYKAKRIVINSNKTMFEMFEDRNTSRTEIKKLEDKIHIIIQCKKEGKIQILKGEMPPELYDFVEILSNSEADLFDLQSEIDRFNFFVAFRFGEEETLTEKLCFDCYVCFHCKKLKLGEPNYEQRYPRDEELRPFCPGCTKQCRECGYENPKCTNQCIACELYFTKRNREEIIKEKEEEEDDSKRVKREEETVSEKEKKINSMSALI